MNSQTIKHAVVLASLFITSISIADTRTITLEGQEYRCESTNSGPSCSGSSEDCGSWAYESQKSHMDGDGWCVVDNIYSRTCKVSDGCGHFLNTYKDTKSDNAYKTGDKSKCQ